jgi:archaetidylinositol phosphate synthase
MSKAGSHTRVHDMLLGPLERPALQWLSARMPSWVTPDILTAIGVVGSFMSFFGYWLSDSNLAFLWLAVLGFVVNWFGDSLDGTVARYRKIERPKFGFYLDHTVDGFSQVIMFVGIGLSPFVRMEFALLALSAYLLMTALAYINAFVIGKFQISYAKIGPTELRVLVILITLYVYFIGNTEIRFGSVTTNVFELFVIVIAVGLFITWAITAISQGVQLKDVDAKDPAGE